jgi:hypothetical protein
MDKLILDPTIASIMRSATSEVELCDASGQTLGYFVPAAERERALYAWAAAQFTDEELERARREPDGLPLAEILKNLRAR